MPEVALGLDFQFDESASIEILARILDAVQDQADFRVAKYGYSVAVDGIFGPTTQLFVRAFQLSAGLASDGVAGQLTWQALVTEAQ